jgi:hypothetical protein
VAELEPGGIQTQRWTLATLALELESDTTTPIPATDVKLTVPVPDWPPKIVLGLTKTLLRTAAGGLTVRPNVTLAPE